jgi:hypothetical protein
MCSTSSRATRQAMRLVLQTTGSNMNSYGQELPSSDTAVCRKRPCDMHIHDACVERPGRTNWHAFMVYRVACRTDRQALLVQCHLCRSSIVNKRSVQTRRTHSHRFQAWVCGIPGHCAFVQNLQQQAGGILLSAAHLQLDHHACRFQCTGGLRLGHVKAGRRAYCGLECKTLGLKQQHSDSLPGLFPRVCYMRQHLDRRRGPQSGTPLRPSCSWQASQSPQAPVVPAKFCARPFVLPAVQQR